MTRRGPLLVLVATFVLLGAPNSNAVSPTVTWSAQEVRVNNPATTFGGAPRGHREPVVAINPRDTRNIIVATSDQNPQNQATEGDGYAAWVHVYRSTDAGATWQDVRLFDWPDPTHAYDSGDPALVFANDGTAYLVALSDDLHVGHHRRLRSYRSTDGGATWSPPGTVFQGVLDPTHNYCVSGDKNLATYNEVTNELIVVFTRTSWDCGEFPDDELVDLGAIPLSADIQLVLTRSKDGGNTWSEPVAIAHGYSIGGNPRVAPDGTIYVGYSTGALVGSAPSCPSALGTVGNYQPSELDEVVASSTDNGATWHYERRPLCDAAVFGSERADLLERANPTGGLTFGSAAVDPSTGIAYAAWPNFAGQPPSVSFGVDVMTSRDRGATWSPTAHVTAPSGDAVLPTLAARGGAAYLSWVATADRWRTYDAYVSSSVDGGATWSPPMRLSTVSGTGDGEIGDYNWIDAVDDRVAVAWTHRRPGSPATDIYVRIAAVTAAAPLTPAPSTPGGGRTPATGASAPLALAGTLLIVALGLRAHRRGAR
jgi:hypothetical protein